MESPICRAVRFRWLIFQVPIARETATWREWSEVGWTWPAEIDAWSGHPGHWASGRFFEYRPENRKGVRLAISPGAAGRTALAWIEASKCPITAVLKSLYEIPCKTSSERREITLKGRLASAWKNFVLSTKCASKIINQTEGEASQKSICRFDRNVGHSRGSLYSSLRKIDSRTEDSQRNRKGVTKKTQSFQRFWSVASVVAASVVATMADGRSRQRRRKWRVRRRWGGGDDESERRVQRNVWAH